MAKEDQSPARKARGSRKPAAAKPKPAPKAKAPAKKRQGSATQKRLAAHKMVVRNAWINTLRAQGLSWKFVSEHEEVKTPISTCKRVYREHLLDPERGVAIENAREIIQDGALKLETLEERMAETYWNVKDKPGDMTSNIIGATRAQADMLHKRLKLLQSSSILPNEIGTIRHVEDAKDFLALVVRILDEEGVPERVFERLMDELPLKPERV